MNSPSSHSGVMDASYAVGRKRAPHLTWRYQVRAAFAAEAFDALRGRPPGVHVLDLGAAEGLTMLHLRDLLGHDGTYDGVELSDELLAAAPPMPPGARLVRGDVMHLPPEIEAGRYDLCVALAVLEHLPDPGACLREAFRALAPGGVLVTSCPHPVWDEIAGHLGMVADEHHETHMNGARMEAIAREAGFADVRLDRFMWAPVGVLPYARLRVPPRLALAIDERVRRLRVFGPSFVNQGMVAIKPASSAAS